MATNKAIPLLTADTLRRKDLTPDWPIPVLLLVANLTASNPELATAAKRKAFAEIVPNPLESISPVSVPNTPPPNNHRNTRQSRQYIYCFMYNRHRQSIELGTVYHSTVDYRQRLGFPYLYIQATDITTAVSKATAVNATLRQSPLEYGDCDYAILEYLEPALHEVSGFIHIDETDTAVPPPLKNVKAIARKRSKKSPAKHTQLAAVINDEDTKRRQPFAPTELDRCKREHTPIVYVVPPPVDTLPPDVSGIRLSKLARDIAAVAASELGLPPLPSELELEEKQEQIRKEKLNREWLRINKPTRIRKK